MNAIRKQLLAIFASDEPEYRRAATLGAAALPVLREMVEEADEDIASSAVYVAALIGTDAALPILATAARRPDSTRGHAVYALKTFVERAPFREQIESAAGILAPMLHDPDPDVRKLAQRAAAAFPQGVIARHAAA